MTRLLLALEATLSNLSHYVPGAGNLAARVDDAIRARGCKPECRLCHPLEV